MPQDAQKSVGVISFYGEQVKKINRLLQQELQLSHLQFRTGTVDKFQGMEMDVILVCMVRNTSKGGDIGFARDYRRLNTSPYLVRESYYCLLEVLLCLRTCQASGYARNV
ncbi:C-terminal helicase domain-containing protein [Lysinibacillus pakistanensis]|uniref:C-terminal helicase domain-containing protein n=1 Tax=Lysinibacillus pakistanensis TaxID=759811 RepID=UPI003D2A43C1